jgi:hypothetical protein
MISRELEFRGIPLSHLGMYFEELGAKKQSNKFPYTYQAKHWRGELLKEEELIFTKVFKVNSVHIRFQARTEEELDDLIKKYRYKTTRIGG